MNNTILILGKLYPILIIKYDINGTAGFLYVYLEILCIPSFPGSFSYFAK